MKESRVLTIKNKIVTLKDLQRLSELISSISPPHSKTEQSKRDASIVVYCNDNSTFESEDPEIFLETSPITLKRVYSVKLSYSWYKEKSYIDIGLRNGSDDFYNQISVRGIDTTWVNGTLSRIQEVINSFEPQECFIFKYKHFFRPLFAFSIGLILFYFMRFLNNGGSHNVPELYEKVNNNAYVYLCIRYTLTWLFGLIPADLLFEHLSRYWPSVELQVGPAYTHFERKRKMQIANVFLIGVFPLIINIIYEIVKIIF